MSDVVDKVRPSRRLELVLLAIPSTTADTPSPEEEVLRIQRHRAMLECLEWDEDSLPPAPEFLVRFRSSD